MRRNVSSGNISSNSFNVLLTVYFSLWLRQDKILHNLQWPLSAPIPVSDLFKMESEDGARRRVLLDNWILNQNCYAGKGFLNLYEWPRQ